MIRLCSMLKTFSEFFFFPRKYYCSVSAEAANRQMRMQSSIMDGENNSKNGKYDGRSKKRQWQDRRSDFRQSKISKTEENCDTISEPFERIKRKKYAMLLGYCGVGYYGMQR